MKNPEVSGTHRERELFFDALELKDDQARVAYLQGACGQDADLRRRVEALLVEHYSNNTLMDNPAVPPLMESGASSWITEEAGSRIGRYKLLQKLGEGGFGIVYMAEQREPVKRRVALKIIKLGMDTRQVVARFEAERQALAMMDHPNIAKVLDGGATETGRPFFVMELVKGVPITRFCNENSLTTRERLELFIPVCQAIQHAHQKGIIHRDIKPSNVMVTLHDGVPIPKVIDFGIAKATQQELTDKTIFTQYQHMLGTPAYMSPEQAELSGLDIDTRSDIYSLGVLLYELLVGRTPLNTRIRDGGTPEEIRRRIREEEAPRPSTCISTFTLEEKQVLHKHQRKDADQIRAELRGDLDWIVLKALEKDRRRRYDTATGLARDIQCYLNHEPVLAAPPSRRYLLRKYVRRHATALAIGLSFLVLILGGAGMSAWQAVRATRAQVEAERASEGERTQRLLAQKKQQEAEDHQKRADQAAVAARTAEESARETAYSAQMLLAQASWNDANLSQLHNLLSATANHPDRGFEWYYWQRQSRLDRATMIGHKETILRLAISPDSQTLASADALGIIKLWNLKTCRERLSIPGHTAEIRGLAFSPDGTVLASGDTNSNVRLWNVETGREIDSFSANVGQIRALRYSRDGRQLAVCAMDGTLHLRELASSQHTIVPAPQTTEMLSLSIVSPDFKQVARGTRNGSVEVWNTATPTNKPLVPWVQPQNPGWRWIHSLDFSPDGRRLCAAAADGEFRVIDTSDGTVRVHLSKVSNRPELFAAFSPDGTRIALAGAQVVRILDAQSGAELHQFKGHRAQIQYLVFSNDGRTLVSADQLGQIKIWDLEPVLKPAPYQGHERALVTVEFSPNGRWILASDWRDRTLLWDAASGQLVKEFRLSGPSGLFPDGRRLLAHHGAHIGSNSLLLVDTETGKYIPGIRATDVLSFAMTPEGKRLLLFSADGGARLWNPDSAEQLASHTLSPVSFKSLAMSTRGNFAAIANAEGVHLLKIDTTHSDKISKLGIIDGSVYSLGYSPDGERLLLGCADGVVKICESATGRELRRLEGHTRYVSSVEFSPDGKRIVTASDDGTVRLWHSGTGNELLSIKAHRRGVRSAKFSPDGHQLVSASASNDSQIIVWQSATPQQVEAWVLEEQDFIENARNRSNEGDRSYLP